MNYSIFIGDYTYSSWSLRGWLLLHRFGLPYTSKMVPFDKDSVANQLADLKPAKTVPTVVTPEGDVIWDSLAIAEELASRHPEAGIWPSDPSLRSLARNLASEMHSGFMSLRDQCPMNLSVSYSDFTPSEQTQADLARLDLIWSFALEKSGGPWLCGEYSAVDAFFAPVVGRIAGYGLQVNAAAQAYVDHHLADPAFRQWRAMGTARNVELPWYSRDFATKPWPGPAPLNARVVEEGTPENDACPYSGKPATHLFEVEGRIFGVCNDFCRAKTVADPAAWPAFMALYNKA
ncbi:stringent starvation protein A [Pelagimonas phthalicica]|uniref:Stringent starvation protein A n=1 Tax=Pelagimonas phthalicica TaxID=1037362 RepID=A0A238J864_9RHOB|nr:glutathione S-transferase [Pelagimonas phthalicica]TDS94561.1 glutathione S-transferase [Pelagimonas phthalicica]SMX26910.1 stringent starvation protein A [Pelagimonas phthalicica]